jgi:hypothetical protein
VSVQAESGESPNADMSRTVSIVHRERIGADFVVSGSLGVTPETRAIDHGGHAASPRNAACSLAPERAASTR